MIGAPNSQNVNYQVCAMKGLPGTSISTPIADPQLHIIYYKTHIFEDI